MPIRHLTDGTTQLSSIDEAFVLAMSGFGTYGLPVALAMTKDAFGKSRPGKAQGYSASQFQGCARKVILQEREQYDEAITDLFWRVKGTLIHAAIEDALAAIPEQMRAHFHSEERLASEVDGIPITGKYDLFYDGDHPIFNRPMLWDHKTTRFCPKEPKLEHIAQTNIYAWLIGKNGQPKPGIIEINYIDGEKAIPFRFEPWSDASVEAYLRRRLAAGLGDAYHHSMLPPRVEKDGWWQCGQNRTNTRYCPFTDRCWPDGIGAENDGWELLP